MSVAVEHEYAGVHDIEYMFEISFLTNDFGSCPRQDFGNAVERGVDSG